jgi:hypothetical protein
MKPLLRFADGTVAADERSYPYVLVDVATGGILNRRLRTPNEAADLNAAMRLNNRDLGHRWLPEVS